MPNGLAGSAQVSYPLLAPSGTAGAPSYSFAAATGNGMYADATRVFLAAGGSAGLYTYGSVGVVVVGTLAFSTNEDVILVRDAANVLAQRNGANAQEFRVYNTYTNASNYERLQLEWIGNEAYLRSESAGTGVARTLVLYTDATMQFASGGGVRWYLSTAGHLLALADNTYDIGANGATRPRTVYAATSFRTDGSYFTAGGLYHTSLGSLVWTADGIVRLTDNAGTSFGRLCFGGTTAAFPAIKRDGANLALVPADGSAGYIDLTVHDLIGSSVYLSNIVSVGANNTNISLGAGGATHSLVNTAASFIIQVTGGAVLATFAGTGYLEMTEVTAPSAPAANSGRLYFEDNGAGKTRLMCLFASGSAQQLAIEP